MRGVQNISGKIGCVKSTKSTKLQPWRSCRKSALSEKSKKVDSAAIVDI
jgi:hypothetical protein